MFNVPSCFARFKVRDRRHRIVRIAATLRSLRTRDVNPTRVRSRSGWSLHRESERAINRPDAMSAGATEIDVRSLQRRAEQAIRTAKPRDYIVRLLEQIVTHAGTDIEAARFAHPHLAELRLE
jgi:hypothetical protein